MIERLLQSQLEPVARRHRQLRLWRSLAVCWGVTALAGLLLFSLSSVVFLPREVALALNAAIAIAGLIASGIYVARVRSDYRQIARQIEREHPDLHSLLVTAVEQRPDSASGQFNYFQARVIREAILQVQARKLVSPEPPGNLKFAHAAHVAALTFAVLVAAKLATVERPPGSSPLLRGATAIASVEPGDVAIEKGTPLFVIARFTGPPPGSATLLVTEHGREPRKLSLERTLADPVFGGSVPDVSAELTYAIEYAGGRTRDYRVTVFEFPKLERADADIKYPEYTGIAAKRIVDTRRISAVEGSRVALELQLNKPVRSARLIAKNKTVTDLLVHTNRAAATLSDFVLSESQSYSLELRDTEGRTNKVPAQFFFDALKNRAPDLKLTAPRGDQRVSPLEELAFAAEASDDYGLRAVGITYTMAGREPASIQLDAKTGPHEKRPFGHLVKLEELHARPDQLLSWFVWADDIGPDGQIRRTSSDMFFAEVRPFDEIYREGAGADGGEQQSGAQAGGRTMKLAELQKQIINATWKLQRQFSSTNATPAYRKDAGVVRESQELALEQAGGLKARVDDPRFKALWEAVENKMQQALDRLAEATNSPATLPQALTAEQAAYQALLSLSAREYQVTRSRSGGGGEAGGERNQQQLENLDLKQDRDRYETQRQAGPQQRPEQREQLAVSSRLRELAQRQQDLNERLKEMQTALKEAKTEEERRELERELKRLRDEQRELLADMDELRQRMDQPQNQSRMAEARQQLEQTREHVQNAAEALENQSVGQALSSGTRAQRELQDLRDDFRKKNSNQFAEDMREMRQTARDLARQQEQISSQIDAEKDQKQKTLTASAEAKELTSKFQQQKEGLTNLLQNMRQVSEQAEASEPMLARQLYDTLRRSSQGNLENNLNLAEELTKRRFLAEAGEFSRRSQSEIDELKRGVEEAASGVLGDEAEALKFAKTELDDLVNQLGAELARAGTNSNSPSGAAPTQQTSEQSAERGDAAKSPQASAQNGQPQAPGQSQDGSQPGSQANSRSSDGNQTGQRSGNANQPGRNSQDANQPGQDSGQAAQTNAGQNSANSSQNPDSRPGGRNARGAFDPARWDQNNDGGGADGGGHGGPLTGQEYREWSERLGNLEDVIDPPELRREVSRIRDRARAWRAEFKRHSKEPQWDLVRTQLFGPLTELRDRVAEELARVQSTESLVPIDRDPVPNKFSDLVRRYYEKLGDSRPSTEQR